MSFLRTFVAVETSPEIRRRAAEVVARLDRADADVKWVAGENLHWTLKFLGDVEDSRIAGVCGAVAEVARSAPPFSLAVLSVGAFPRAARPRTLWLGAAQGSDEMILLAVMLDDALSRLGFPREARDFIPHATLGRVRGARNLSALATLIDELRDFDAGVMQVDELVVFSSRLTPAGAVYEPLGRATLGGASQRDASNS
jgi:2'-5' RNA ligase